MQSHPDQVHAQYLLSGLRDGFRIGFDQKQALQSAPKNMCSAAEHPEVVLEYRAEEMATGRVVGLLKFAR